MKTIWKITRSQVMEGLGYSYWLKDAVEASASRDIVDALRDAEILTAILTRELEALKAAEAQGY